MHCCSFLENFKSQLCQVIAPTSVDDKPHIYTFSSAIPSSKPDAFILIKTIADRAMSSAILFINGVKNGIDNIYN